MLNNFLGVLFKVTSLTANQRRLILMSFDVILINLTLSVSNLLSNSSISTIPKVQIFLNIFSSVVGLILFAFTGQYKSLMFYFEISSLYSILIRNLIFLSFINVYTKIFYGFFENIFFNLLFFLILSILILFSRLLLRDLFRLCSSKKRSNYESVIIFGAGSAGAQLEAALRLGGKYSVKCFIDESPKLWGRYLNGIKIYPPSFLKNEIKIQKILIAIPSLTNQKRRALLKKLEETLIPIFQIPSIEDIATGKKAIDTFKPIEIEDLLSRDIVKPKSNLLKSAISDYVVCVTGAGGSIGSELCRQISKLIPSKLILIDNSEHNLYLIKDELQNCKDINFPVDYLLGDVSNSNFVRNIFTKNKIDIVFHAAAYKHVPIVEDNPFTGLKNNVFSTKNICEEALSSSIKKVILISSDKAVRPTNIMGVSKRIAELIIQGCAKEIEESSDNTKANTKFAMVRFGNVLNSSGSVIPLFKNQIAKGGPVTITDPKVIRYFMTINEAVQLVLQASTMADGGDVFLLDMGKPVSILKLAKQMIKLSGFTIKDKKNPTGDIEISNIGLRSGEKLFEELLINADAQLTKHPLIFKANESYINKKQLWKSLDEIYKLIDSEIDENLRTIKLEKVLRKIVPEWIGKIKFN